MSCFFFPPHVNRNFHMWKQNTWNLLLHMWIQHLNTFYFNITTKVFHMWTWSFHGCFGLFSNWNENVHMFQVWLAFSTCENKTWHIKSCEICFITCEFHIFTCIWLFFPCETHFFCQSLMMSHVNGTFSQVSFPHITENCDIRNKNVHMWIRISSCRKKTLHIKSCEIYFVTCEIHILTQFN